MSHVARLSILALFTGVLLTACGSGRAGNSPAATAAANSNSVQTSVEELDQRINIPYEAEDCTWKEDASHKKLTAVLRFENENTAKLAAELEKLSGGEDVVIPAEPWFPSDLNVESDVRGDDQLRGKAYPANSFFQEPHSAGRVIRIQGTEFFVLQLTAK